MSTDSLRIGPDTQTGHSGRIHVFSRYPGLVTIQALTAGGVDVSSILSQSSFTVGGSVDSTIYIAGGNVGLAVPNFVDAQKLARRRNFAIGLELNFYEGQIGGYNYASITQVLQSCGYNSGQINYQINTNCMLRRMGAGQYSVPPANVNFTKVFPFGRTRAVFIFGNDYWRMVTLLDDESISHNAINSDITFSSNTNAGMQFNGFYSEGIISDFQFFDAIPTGDRFAGEIFTYLNGGNLGATQLCNLNIKNIESGDIAYDLSGNNIDWSVEPYRAGYYYSRSYKTNWQRVVTGLTGNEQTINYDTTGIAPGTVITLIAKRAKGGFPQNRTPAIHEETDTCTIIAAAAPGLAVVGVSLNKQTASLTIENPTDTLVPTVWPLTATNRGVTWLSSAPSIVGVSAGQITRLAGGPATITCTTDDGGFTATCLVSAQPAATIRNTDVESICDWLQAQIAEVQPSTGDPRVYFTRLVGIPEQPLDIGAQKDRSYNISLMVMGDSTACFGAKQALIQLEIVYQNDVAYEDINDIEKYILRHAMLDGVLGVQVGGGTIQPVQGQDRTVNILVSTLLVDYKGKE